MIFYISEVPFCQFSDILWYCLYVAGTSKHMDWREIISLARGYIFGHFTFFWYLWPEGSYIKISTCNSLLASYLVEQWCCHIICIMLQRLIYSILVCHATLKKEVTFLQPMHGIIHYLESQSVDECVSSVYSPLCIQKYAFSIVWIHPTMLS
jgi:hypothetical protein